jgi:diguanylate cyclase (GGDEF)-like protein
MQGESAGTRQAGSGSGSEPHSPPKLPLYNLVSRLPGPRSFAVRIFLLSFISTQLPMFLLLLYVVLNVELNAEILTTVSIVLITALLGSASTVLALIAYAEPVNAISKAVHNFAYADRVPDLPDTYNDEIGELMANTQGALKKLHSMLHNMHELSIRDELTGLYNRRFFSEQAELLLIRAMRYEEPLTLIFIDIDDFKSINDRYSHQVGDSALRQIATIMTDTARGSDLTARLGGDEFVIMLPNTPLERAHQISERLRTAMENHDWSALIPGAVITISIGMAAAQEYDTIEKLMDRADSNLFRAKKGGRNQIQA